MKTIYRIIYEKQCTDNNNNFRKDKEKCCTILTKTPFMKQMIEDIEITTNKNRKINSYEKRQVIDRQRNLNKLRIT